MGSRAVTSAAAASAGARVRWLGCRCCGLACRVAAPDGRAGLAAAAAAARADPAAGQRVRCPRCSEPLPRREALNSQRTWALLLASVVAYVPANLLPIMSTTSALQPTSHTILGGIADLWTSGAWVLAIIVFIASIAVPLLKIGALALLAWAEQHAPRWRRPERATLYRLVDAVGHWSMLDIYVVVLLTAMVHFGGLANVSPEPGLLAFAAMVILTLVAAHSVDPLRIWAAPGSGASEAPGPDAAAEPEPPAAGNAS